MDNLETNFEDVHPQSPFAQLLWQQVLAPATINHWGVSKLAKGGVFGVLHRDPQTHMPGMRNPERHIRQPSLQPSAMHFAEAVSCHGVAGIHQGKATIECGLWDFLFGFRFGE